MTSCEGCLFSDLNHPSIPGLFGSILTPLATLITHSTNSLHITLSVIRFICSRLAEKDFEKSLHKGRINLPRHSPSFCRGSACTHRIPPTSRGRSSTQACSVSIATRSQRNLQIEIRKKVTTEPSGRVSHLRPNTRLFVLWVYIFDFRHPSLADFLLPSPKRE